MLKKSVYANFHTHRENKCVWKFNAVKIYGFFYEIIDKYFDVYVLLFFDVEIN